MSRVRSGVLDPQVSAVERIIVHAARTVASAEPGESRQSVDGLEFDKLVEALDAFAPGEVDLQLWADAADWWHLLPPRLKSLGRVEPGTVLVLHVQNMNGIIAAGAGARMRELRQELEKYAGHDQFMCVVVEDKGWQLELVHGEVGAPLPEAPDGFACCRFHPEPATMESHLVVVVDGGFHGPTLCGLTRFDTLNKNGDVVRPADIPGWDMNGGHHGPGVRQVQCGVCWERADG